MKSTESGNPQIEIQRVSSFLEQPDGESAQLTPQPSPLATEYCIELLRDLSSTFAAVLINAQVLDGKIPSYSRSKRYVHEIERSVQRGGALLKRLLDRLPAGGTGACDKDGESCDREFGLGKGLPPVAERTAVVANQGPNAPANSALDFAPSAAAQGAPAFRSPAGECSQEGVIAVLAFNSQKGTIKAANSQARMLNSHKQNRG